RAQAHPDVAHPPLVGHPVGVEAQLLALGAELGHAPDGVGARVVTEEARPEPQLHYPSVVRSSIVGAHEVRSGRPGSRGRWPGAGAWPRPPRRRPAPGARPRWPGARRPSAGTAPAT